MVVKITKAHESTIKCLSGLCGHTYETKGCPYNTVCNAADPLTEMERQIKKIIAEVVKYNLENQSRAKITTKEDKCKTKKPSSTSKK